MDFATVLRGLASITAATLRRRRTRRTSASGQSGRGNRYPPDRHPNTQQPRATVYVHPYRSLGWALQRQLVQRTAWTSGQLDDYLGLNVATPVNPIGAYIQPNAGQTGWWVYQANLGTRTLPGAPTDAFTMLLGGGGGSLPFGAYIVGYLTPCPATEGASTVCDATANSAAIREVGTPRRFLNRPLGQ